MHAKLLVISTLLHFLKRTFDIGENFNICLNSQIWSNQVYVNIDFCLESVIKSQFKVLDSQSVLSQVLHEGFCKVGKTPQVVMERALTQNLIITSDISNSNAEITGKIDS